MNHSEEHSISIQEQKSKIRERYRGVDPDTLECLPARPPENIYDEDRELRVAVYARVSTDDPRQTSSYELQKNHYAKYGAKGLLPELHVISDGVLKGFVAVNPRWAGFKAPDYNAAYGFRQPPSQLEIGGDLCR